MFLIGPTTLALLAGILSILSPCILPILPIALGGAAAAHRYSPVALAAGLALSFTTIGLLIATLGISIGLTGSDFQIAGAVLLILLGVVLIAPPLQDRFATAAGPMGNWVQERLGGFSTVGFRGQFGLGLLFGAIWSPCSGPTLGAAAVMAASGHNMIQATSIMLAFGVGASLPLLALSAVSRATFLSWRAKLAGTGSGGKLALGVILIAFGGLILTGANQVIETFLVANSPDWLMQLTARY